MAVNGVVARVDKMDERMARKADSHVVARTDLWRAEKSVCIMVVKLAVR